MNIGLLLWLFILTCGEPGLTTVLSDSHYENAYPYWSPDEKKIVFQSNMKGNRDIFVMNADGSSITQLTTSNGMDMMPAWSPDGTRIAFVTNRDERSKVQDLEGNTEVYIMNADGSDQRNISNHPGRDIHPNWSPDSRYLIFNSTRANTARVMKHEFEDFDLYEADVVTGSIRRITNNLLTDTYASFSPDGKKIASRRVIDQENSEVFVMNRDGSNGINITSNDAFDAWPAWSPDGKYLLFSSDRSGSINLYRMKPDGTEVTNLTNNAFYNSRANWSRDGSKIVFNIQRNDMFGIYWMKSNAQN